MILRQYLHDEPVIAASYLVGWRRCSRAFALTDEEPFARLMLEDMPRRPPRAEEVRARNPGRAFVAR